MGNELMKPDSKAWVIWASCLEAPRSVNEIAEAWGYNVSSGALYQGEMISKLLDQKIITVKNAKSGTNYYSANFDWLTKKEMETILKHKEAENNKDVNEFILNNFASYKALLESNREYYFKLESLKKYFCGNPDLIKGLPNHLLTIPLVVDSYSLAMSKVPASYMKQMRKQMQVSMGNVLDLFGYIDTLAKPYPKVEGFEQLFKR